MKNKIKYIAFFILIVGIFFIWNIFGPTISAPKEKYFFLKTGSNYSEVKKSLKGKGIIKNSIFFDLLTTLKKYPEHIKPGRYEIADNSSLFNLIRMLNAGQQSPVRFVITKLRTKEDLASKIASNFDVDSLNAIRFLLSNDSLASYQLDTNTVMSVIIPNSYFFWWNSSMRKIMSRLKSQHDYFWEGRRIESAKKLGLNELQVYTIGSIIEEETNAESDKGKIASVYINRLKKGMKLEADPTVKYAMRNFSLTRIMYEHLKYLSPYNTYQITGLPPGPICTPSISTIDDVLESPKTDYIFFVAKPDFSGYSNFSNNYSKHLENAKLYQKALDIYLSKKENRKR